MTKSPFPGMDPFIEVCRLWEGFHGRLISAIEIALSERVPHRYIVDLGVRYYVVLTTSEPEKILFASDVGVSIPEQDRPNEPGLEPLPGSSELLDRPVTMLAFNEISFKETFIEIREANPESRLVTTIEVLSPSNKRPGSKGRKEFMRKRQSCLRTNSTNFVEIDFLRKGRRMPMSDPWPNSPYYILSKLRLQDSHCQVWPAYSLRQLPDLVVPLLKPDPDVHVPLQPLVNQIYDRSRYQARIDYRRASRIGLTLEEVTWLDQHLPPPANGAAPS